LISFLSFSCSNNKSEIEFIPFETKEGFQFVNKKGDTLINQEWYKVDLFTDNMARVQSKEKPYRWGFMNDEGDTVVKPVYLSATKFNEGIAFIVQDSLPPIAINDEGEKLFDLNIAEDVNMFHEGLAPFSVGSNDHQEFIWGFINKKGEVEIQPQFYNVYHFAEGLCPVQDEDGNWGYINKKGKLVIEYQFDKAYPFIDKIAVVALGNFYGVIDAKGNYIINPRFELIQPDGDLFLIMQDDKYGWIDKQGNFKINPQFEYAYGFNGNKYAPVRIQSISEWGYINEDGLITIKPRFRYALPFDGKTALVKKGKNYGFLNDKGEIILETKYTGLSDTYIENWNPRTRFRPNKYHVKTNYFNHKGLLDSIKMILSATRFNKINFGDSLVGILNKYNIAPDRLPKRSGSFEYPLKDYYVTNDARVTFSMKIKAYDEKKVKKKYEGYSYYNTEYLFNDTIKPESFTYVFSLNERGRGMASKIIEEIFDSMKNYELTEEDRNGNKTFKKGNHLYRVGKYYRNGIKIEISKS
jgi:hypothetical protein